MANAFEAEKDEKHSAYKHNRINYESGKSFKLHIALDVNDFRYCETPITPGIKRMVAKHNDSKRNALQKVAATYCSGEESE